MPTLEKRVREVFLDTFHEGGLVGLNNNLPRRMVALFQEYQDELVKSEIVLPKDIENFIAVQETVLARGRNGK